MQLTLAIIIRELIGRPRHRFFYIRRLSFVAAGVILLLIGFFHQWVIDSGSLGRELFRLLAVLGVAAACFAGPASASAYFAREKEMKTLGLLLLADISPLQLVISRLAGSFLLVGTLCLSLLPFFVLSFQISGGQAPVTITGVPDARHVLHGTHALCAVGILLATVGLGTSIGLLLSALMMDEMMAFFSSLITSACLFIVLPGMLFMLGNEAGINDSLLGTQILPAVSPYYALRATFHADGLAAGGDVFSWWNVAWPSLLFIGQALVVTVLLVALTSRILPGRALAPQRNVDPRYLQHMSARRVSREIKGNPLVWKENPNTGNSLFYFSMTAGILVALPYGMNRQAMGFSIGLAMFVVSAVIMGLGLLIRGALAFVHEKEMRTFELLLISGLGEEDIIMGKYWGYLKCYIPWLISLGAAFVLMAFYEGFWRIAMAYLVFLTLMFAYLNLAFVFSLIFRRMIALLSTFFIFVFWAVAGPFLFLKLDSNVWLISGVIVAHLVLGCVFFEMIFRIFRRHTRESGVLRHYHVSAG